MLSREWGSSWGHPLFFYTRALFRPTGLCLVHRLLGGNLACLLEPPVILSSVVRAVDTVDAHPSGQGYFPHMVTLGMLQRFVTPVFAPAPDPPACAHQHDHSPPSL